MKKILLGLFVIFLFFIFSSIALAYDYTQACTSSGGCSCDSAGVCGYDAACLNDNCGSSCPAAKSNSQLTGNSCSAGTSHSCSCDLTCQGGSCSCTISGNCEYTCDDGYEWDGDSCIVSNNPPLYIDSGTNTTDAGEPCLFYEKWYDLEGNLSHYIFSTNNTGTWTNESATAFSAVNNSWSNITKTLNSTSGLVIGWKVYANDTDNAWNTSSHSLTTVDSTNPLWDNQGQNSSSIATGEGILLYSQGYDETGLDYAWLSTNETGSWANKTTYSSPADMGDASATWTWSNFTWLNSSVTEGIIGWKVYYNDTSGNENVTDVLTFTVSKPTINQIQCAINTDTNWTDCDTAMWGTIIKQIRVNCTSDYSDVESINYNLTNIPDSYQHINEANATSVSGDWWILNNTDLSIYDSGTWNLTVICTDSNSATDESFSNWTVAWGHMEPYLIGYTVNANTDVNQKEFFTFDLGFTCRGGECGDINITLDPEQENIASPKIKDAYVEPTDVLPGDTMEITAIVEDESGIESVTAEMPHEKGVDLLDLYLQQGTTEDGKWFAEWLVHDTKVKEYKTKITATNMFGKKSTRNIFWTDSDTSYTQSCQSSGSCSCKGGDSCAARCDYTESVCDWCKQGTCSYSCPSAKDHSSLGSNSCNAGYSHDCLCDEDVYGYFWCTGRTCSCTISGSCTYNCDSGWYNDDGSLGNGCENAEPTINSITTDPSTPYYGNTVQCEANITELNNDDIDWVNFTIISGNGSTIINNVKGSQNGDIWTSSSFNIDAYGTWNCSVVASDNRTRTNSDYTTWSASQKTGAISTTTGDTPFYTNESNPQTCSAMKHLDTCNKTWYVNATGEDGTMWRFYGVYNATNYSSYVSSNTTGKTNITIVVPTCALSFNPSSPQTYPEAITATCGCTGSKTAHLYRNGTDVTASENNTAITLGAATHSYVCNITTSIDYPSDQDTDYFVINKAKPIISLSNNTYSLNTSGLVGYWRFESANSTNYTLDSSGYDNDALLVNFTNNPPQTTAGRIENGFTFDGDDDYAKITATESLNISDAITLGAWVKPESNMENFVAVARKNYAYLLERSSSNVFRAGVYVDGDFRLSGDVAYTPDVWSYWVMTYSSSTKDIKLYVNATLATNNTLSGLSTYNINMNALNLCLGNAYCDNQNVFNGTIDEIILFNRELSADEIALLYETSKPYPTQTNFSYSESNSGDNGVTYNFYQNTTSKSTPDTATYGGGYYYYLVNTTGGANYTERALTIPLEITQASGSCSLSSSSGWTYSYGSATTLTCACTGDGTAHLYFDGTEHDEYNNTAMTFAADETGYSVICNITSTANYTSASDSNTLTIQKQGCDISLWLNSGSTDADNSITYPTQANATAIVNNSQSFNLDRNTTNVDSGSGTLQEIKTLGVSVYNYTAYYTATQNYSACTETSYLTVNQNNTNPVDIYLINSTDTYKNQNMTVEYGEDTTANVTASYSDSGNASLYRDGSSVSNPEGPITLGVGTYSYKGNITGNANYTSNSTGATFYVIVNKASGSCALSFNPSSPQTYPKAITATCGCVGDGIAKLYRNGTDVTSENDTSITLGAATYNYICNITETSNYTSSSNSANYIINQNSTNPVGIYFQNSTGVYKNQNITVTYDAWIKANATLSYSNSGSPLLYRDESSVSNPENITLGSGTYAYKGNTTGNTNYTSNATGSTFYVTVNQGTLNVTITSPTNSSSHDRGSTVTLTALLQDQDGDSVSGATVEWYNSTTNIASGTSGSWTVPIEHSISTENIICNATKGNYSMGQDSVTINVQNALPNVGTPTYNVTPAQIERGNGIEISCAVTDTEDSSADLDVNVSILDPTNTWYNASADGNTGDTFYRNFGTDGSSEIGTYTALCRASDTDSGSVEGSNSTFTVYVNGTITVNLNSTVVWWDEGVNIYGQANRSTGEPISLTDVNITVGEYSVCSGTTTDADGAYTCDFSAPDAIGNFSITIETEDTETNTAITNTTKWLSVEVNFGGTTTERDTADNVGCYEVPQIVQNPDGSIRKVKVRICVWK